MYQARRTARCPASRMNGALRPATCGEGAGGGGAFTNLLLA